MVSEVTEFLGHPVAELRQAAAAAIAEMGSSAAHPEVIGRLAPLLRDRDEDVRFAQGLDTHVPAGERVSVIPAVAGGALGA